MGVIPLDWDVVRASVARATSDVAKFLRTVPDDSAPVPGLEWNVGEVGAHLVTAARGYLGFAEGQSSSLGDQSMAEVNEERLRDYTTRDTSEIAGDLVSACEAFLSAIADDDSLMTLSEVHLDRSTAAAVLLGELRIHELDISRAVGRPWNLSRDEALLIGYAALAVVHKFVDPVAAHGFRATYEVRFRGGETVSMTFTDGDLTVTRGPSPRADCRISADPVASLLVGYGRVSRWGVGLRGKVMAYGRKPWLAIRFNKLIAGA